MGKRNDSVKVLITSSEKGRVTAREFTEIYRELFDVVLMETSGFEEALETAGRSDMTHMLYFKDERNLILTSLADEMGGYSLDITVDDLRRVLS